MVVPPQVVQDQLDSADLIANIKVQKLENFPDPEHFAKFQATAQITSIEKISSSLKDIPAVGDSIAIRGLGGEWAQRGVVMSGHPKPYVGRDYKAYLRLESQNFFSLTGYEAGLTELNPGRKFSRNRTDGSNGEGNGAFLYWDDKFLPIPYYVSVNTFLGLQNFISAIDDSFKTWRDVNDIKIEFLPMGCSSSAKNENEGLNHVVLVTDAWTFSDPQVIAITRNFYVAGNGAAAGQILDSDILLNGVNHQFTTTGEAGKNDVQNIVTHEVGHFLGLGHEVTPTDSDAVMFANAIPNETKKRVLKNSDLEGIRNAYWGLGNKTAWIGSPCAVSGASCLATHQRQSSPSDMVLLAIGLLFLFVVKKFSLKKRDQPIGR